MKRAVHLPQYSNTTDFTPPAGVVTVSLDKTTNLLATASCPDDYNSAFVEGSEPKETCDRADQRNIFQKILGVPAPRRRRSTSRRACFRPASRARPWWSEDGSHRRQPTPNQPARAKRRRDSGERWWESSGGQQRSDKNTGLRRRRFQLKMRLISCLLRVQLGTPGPEQLPSSRVCAARRSRSSRWRWRKWARARLPQARTK